MRNLVLFTRLKSHGCGNVHGCDNYVINSLPTTNIKIACEPDQALSECKMVFFVRNGGHKSTKIKGSESDLIDLYCSIGM